jgi:hypothetical protein
MTAGAATAATDPQPQHFAVTGNAPQICTVADPVLGSGSLTNFLSLNGTMLQVDQLADPQTLATRPAAAEVDFAAMCNFPHRIVLESQNNGLWRGGASGAPAPSGFADGVPYTAALTWGPVNQSLFVDATARRTSQLSAPVGVPVAGDIKLRLTIQAGASNLTANAPLIAGVYSDTLFVTVEPQ